MVTVPVVPTPSLSGWPVPPRGVDMLPQKRHWSNGQRRAICSAFMAWTATEAAPAARAAGCCGRYSTVLICGDCCSPCLRTHALVPLDGGGRHLQLACCRERPCTERRRLSDFICRASCALLGRGFSIRHAVDPRSADDRIAVFGVIRCLPVHAARSAAPASFSGRGEGTRAI